MRKSIITAAIAASLLVPAMAVAECNRFNRPDGIFSPCNQWEKAVYSCVCDANGQCGWTVVCYPTDR